jgi:adenylate cyclase
MQNAMAEVNKRNHSEGLPDLEMGIGLNETEVIVGNIGSSKRSKYAVVGSGVNLTSRIESYTVGGQILISESVYREAESLLRIDTQRNVFPKGSETPLSIYEVGGIAGSYNIALKGKTLDQVTLSRQIPLQYSVVEGKAAEEERLGGFIAGLSKNGAEIIFNDPPEVFANLKMNLADVDENLSTKHFYGKAIQQSEKNDKTSAIRFTMIPPEVDAYFQALRQHVVKNGTI